MLQAICRPLTAAVIFALAAIYINWWAFAPLFSILMIDVVFCAIGYREGRGRALTSGALLRRAARSWCSRGVAIALWGNTARIYFRALGYKPWHILPDGFPFIYLRRSFWTNFIRPGF